jgi:arylsulfatase
LLERFASGHTQGKPWFLAVNLINPHDIMFFDVEGDGGALVGTPTMPAPGTPLYDREWDFALPRSFAADDLSTKPAVQRPGQRLTEQEARVFLNYYYNCIRDVDQHVGALLAALERLDLADDTIVVVTADHGERGGAHGGMVGKGADVYKETLRVPLIVRHPGLRGGSTDALAGGIDLAPTLLGFAAVSDAARAVRYPALKGVDLRDVISNERPRTARDERGILLNYVTAGALTPDGPAANVAQRGLIRGVYDGRYKFARYFKVTEHHQPRDWETLLARNDLELYDTQQDPDEIVNLAAQPEAHRDRILALNAKINALIDTEVGADDGSIYPGPTSAYTT